LLEGRHLVDLMGALGGSLRLTGVGALRFSAMRETALDSRGFSRLEPTLNHTGNEATVSAFSGKAISGVGSCSQLLISGSALRAASSPL
jgi:hypothetical protein